MVPTILVDYKQERVNKMCEFSEVYLTVSDNEIELI
jgi:hypothetical protein